MIKKLKILNLKMILSEAEADVKHKRIRSARTFIKELKGSIKVSH